MRFFRSIGKFTGWQRFGFEVAIIVIGVGLAMGADQIITSINRKAETRQAMNAVETDLMTLLSLSSERMAVEPCRREQVENLAARLQEPGETWDAGFIGDLTPENNPLILRQVLRTPIRNWPDGSWKALLASDAALYIDRGQFIQLSSIFDVAAEISDLQTRALVLKGNLAALGLTGPITAGQRREAYAALGELSAIEGLISVHARQLRDRIASIDYRYDRRLGDFPPEPPEDILRTAEAEFLEVSQTVYGGCVDAGEYGPFFDQMRDVLGLPPAASDESP